MLQMNKHILLALKRYGYVKPKLWSAWDISPCDIKDWDTGPWGYTCGSLDTITGFLDGFTEEQIAKSARWSCIYAIYIKKGRFPKGEPAMQNCRATEHWWKYYSETMERMDRGLEAIQLRKLKKP
jgi:hypothetical protein